VYSYSIITLPNTEKFTSSLRELEYEFKVIQGDSNQNWTK